MRIFQNLILIALMALAMTACEKENTFNLDGDTSATAKILQEHNHTHTKEKCGSKAHTEERLLDPTYRANRERNIANFQNKLRNAVSRSACNSPTILPVAIHYQGSNSTDRACLEAIAQKAIEAVNKDFSATNDDISQWDNVAARFYPNINKGVTCLAFQIASKNHPSGFGLQNGDLAVTINQTNDDFLPKWKGYINIIVADIDGLGYAPFGGDGLGDGLAVHINAFAIGSMRCGNVRSPQPNHLGRTLTHELGHYLHLEHLWGDDGGCNQDDGVADTPNQPDENYGCPTLGDTPGCTEEALHMNYMDYPDDPCMYMFTAGQSRRMEAWVNSVLSRNLKTNVLGGTSGGVTTTGTNTNTTTTTTEEEEEEEELTTSKITMKVTLDEFGSETTFAILDGEGYVIKEYGPFQDGQDGKVIKRNIDLPRGIYTFLIEDEYGDGTCCEYGRGKWRLFKNGTRIKSSNGNFGYWEEYDFSVGSARMSGPTHRKDAKDLETLKTKVKQVKI